MQKAQVKFFSKIIQKILTEDNYRVVFNLFFKELKTFVPFDRISLALVKNSWVITEIVKTTYPSPLLTKGNKALLKDTSLYKLARTNEIRIINNLNSHFKRRKQPLSNINQKILKEGILSSLTVPLIIKNDIFGFIFFSSRQPNTYKRADAIFFKDTAELMAIALQKSLLITEMKNSYTIMANTNKKLIKANQLNDEVLSIAAHDIKNLVHPIKLSADALNRHTSLAQDKHAATYIKNIRDISTQLSTLVSNILDISKIKKGKTTLELTDFSVKEALKTVLAIWKIYAVRKKITLQFHIASNFPDIIRADQIKFAQIFNNLVSNAIKFTNEYGCITINVKKEDKFFVFAVQDTGRGIEPKHLKDIFHQFHGPKHGTKGEIGTGFGLSVVKQIVTLHKGRIEVKSKIGKGSTFKFFLPIL